MQSKSKHVFKRTSNFGRKIIVSVSTILVVLAIILFFLGRNYMKSSLLPLNRHSTEMVQVRIPLGASNRKIGSILQKRRVVRNGLMFDYYVKSHDIRKFQAGYYRFSPSMSLRRISYLLQRGGLRHPINPKMLRMLTVTRGMSRKRLVRQIHRQPQVSSRAFVNLLRSRRFAKRISKKYPDLQLKSSLSDRSRFSLLDDLMPGKYDYRVKSSFGPLVDQMLSKTNRVLKANRNRLKHQNVTAQQALNLSSIAGQYHLDAGSERALSKLIIDHSDALRPNVTFVVSKPNGQVLNRKRINLQDHHFVAGSARDVRNVLLVNRVSSRLVYSLVNANHQVFSLNQSPNTVHQSWFNSKRKD